MTMNLREIIHAKMLGGGSGGSSGGGSSGGGGGAVAVSPKEVNFYDYDGTCVHAYTVAEAQAMSALPAGPEHPGLVFQGWNWSLEGVKGLTRAMNIGAMYTTDDGTTRLYITLQEGRTSPMLGVGVNGTVTVDWGDGTETDVLTGTSMSTTRWTPNHAYAKPGDYVIRLAVDGEMAFTGRTSNNEYANILHFASGADVRNRAYQNSLQKMEIGSGVTDIGNYAFHSCYSLASITIPDSVTRIGAYAFYSCYSLSSITIPDDVTDIGNYVFQNCRSLSSISIPGSVTKIVSYAFHSCYSLASITIPDSVTRIEGNAFQACHSLSSIIIPGSVTGFGSSAFYECYSLSSVVIPGSVTKIDSYTFQNCYGISFIDFTACASVPTLNSTSAFSGIPDDCIFLIPAALYDEWTEATNWTTFADRCVAK